MTDYDELTVMAYADGELDPATRAAIDAAMQRDPALAARVRQHQALRASVSAAFAEVADEAIPARLQRAVHGTTPPLQAIAQEVQAPTPPVQRPTSHWSQWGALAATLIVGILVGAIGHEQLQTTSSASAAGIATIDGRLVAHAGLATALDQQSSSERDAASATQIGMTFAAHDGGYCRSFVWTPASQSTPGKALAGLACRKPADATPDWQIPVLAEAAPNAAPVGNYRQAASAVPAAVLTEIDQRMRGAPLDAAAERALLSRRWRR
ncbi:MAG: hypothetical protein M3N23_11890 [Pseudomonadota bacterium]|nr:hypothetical protein [Pseudomonadota bacterium]